LIEVKSSTRVEDYHYDDVSFQYYVVDSAGFRINKCYMMHINSAYIRKVEINVNEIFLLHDIADEVVRRQSEVLALLPGIVGVLYENEEMQLGIGLHCFFSFECGYKEHCWKHIPDHSMFDVFTKKKAFSLAEELGGFELNGVPPEECPSGNKVVDLLSHKKCEIHADKGKLSEFISDLKYPIYYLDCETTNPAVPLFDDSRPYQKILFQFSLLIQHEQDGELEYNEFLHDSRTDPRSSFVGRLVELCGEVGSVVVYNQPFE